MNAKLYFLSDYITSETKPSDHPLEGSDIVSLYTREQALEDGEILDISTLSKEAGFVFPVSITRGVKHLVSCSKRDKQAGQSETGRLWDILFLLRCEMKKPENKKDYRIIYEAIIFKDGKREKEKFLAQVDGDSSGNPVLTISLLSEY